MHTADPLTSSHPREALDRAVIREAAQWLVRWHESAQDPQLAEQLAQWRARSDQHEQAWRRALQVNDKFGLVPPQLGMSVLSERTELSRRRAIKSLVLLMTVVPAGVAGYQVLPWREWQADYATRTGQQRTLTLNDGSELTLNTDTALDVRYDRTQRLIRLHRGELLIDTGADPAAAAGTDPTRWGTGVGYPLRCASAARAYAGSGVCWRGRDRAAQQRAQATDPGRSAIAL